MDNVNKVSNFFFWFLIFFLLIPVLDFAIKFLVNFQFLSKETMQISLLEKILIFTSLGIAGISLFFITIFKQIEENTEKYNSTTLALEKLEQGKLYLADKVLTFGENDYVILKEMSKKHADHELRAIQEKMNDKINKSIFWPIFYFLEKRL